MPDPASPASRMAAGASWLWPIEGLRGLAALMVMWWHYRHWVLPEHGVDAFAYTGVDLFFVLSGFVFAPYVFGKPLALGPYMLRRVLRIFPLYVVALLLYVALRHAQGAQPWRYFWQHLAMLHTSVSQEMAAYYNGAFWSLPVELEFYVLVPLLAWLVAQRQWWFGAILGLALGLHAMLAYWAVPGLAPMPLVLANVHWPGLWGEFLLGCLAWRASRWPGARLWAPWMLGLAIALWLSGAMVWVTVGDAGVSGHPLLRGNMGYWAALAYALVVCALGARMGQPVNRNAFNALTDAPAIASSVHTGSVAAPRQEQGVRHSQVLEALHPTRGERFIQQGVGSIAAVRRRWLVGLSLLGGQLSFGVYLLHNAGQELSGLWWPGLAGWPRVMAAAALTLVAAWLLHHAVEAPARAWGRRWKGATVVQGALAASSGPHSSDQ